MIDSSSLKVLAAVAKAGSFSKAAEQLFTVQSNVTAHIKRLEQQLDIELFYRKSRGVALTPAGKKLYDYSVKILYLLDEAEKAVQDNPEQGGNLAIGSTETTAIIRLPKVLADFHKAYPKIHLKLETDYSSALIDKVMSHELEAAFVSQKVEHPLIRSQLVYKTDLALLAPMDIKTLEEAKEANFLVFKKGCAFREVAESFMKEKFKRTNPLMEFTSIDIVLACIAAGMGVSLLPEILIKKAKQHKGIQAFKIPKPLRDAQIHFITHKDAKITKAMEKLLELVKKDL
jgi:DNA-binding transcriptional LysR family regulator